MLSGNIAPDEWVRLAQAAQIISKLNIYIDDSASITVPEIKSRLMRMKNLGLVVVDYLQLMTTGAKRSDNRVQEVSEITRSLKILAKDLNIPVITASQLSRGPEGRKDNRPMLSDLRESGSIEQDADIVLMLYRDYYYTKSEESKNLAECIISKNRHGEVGKADLFWDGEFARFGNLENYRDDQ